MSDPDTENFEQSKQLFEKAKEGDLEAFGQLVRLHEGKVRAYLRSRLRDWSSADDLAQDVFVTAFKKIDTFRGESAFDSWLMGIALNHLRNFIRKKKEESIGDPHILEALLNRSADEWLEAPENQRLDELRECLEKVDCSGKELLMKRYHSGMTVREIEKETGRGYSALTMKLFRLRESLAECMERKASVR